MQLQWDLVKGSQTRGGKGVNFLFFSGLKKTKTSKFKILVFNGCLGINFWYKFCAQTIRLLFY